MIMSGHRDESFAELSVTSDILSSMLLDTSFSEFIIYLYVSHEAGASDN